MQLEGKHPIGSSGLLVVVRQFGSLYTINIVYEMEALGGNAVGIPIPFLDRFSYFLGISELLGGFLQFTFVIQGKRGVKPAIRKDTAKCFAVANPGIAIAGLEIGLVSTDPPSVMLAGLYETTVLNTGVATLDLEIESEVEILQDSTLPYNEGISTSRGFLGGLADDGSVFHFPKLGITIPILEGLAVEEAFSLFGEGAVSQHQGQGGSEDNGEDS